MPASPGNWHPKSVISVVAAFMSSNRTLRVETDLDEGYLDRSATRKDRTFWLADESEPVWRDC